QVGEESAAVHTQSPRGWPQKSTKRHKKGKRKRKSNAADRPTIFRTACLLCLLFVPFCGHSSDREEVVVVQQRVDQVGPGATAGVGAGLRQLLPLPQRLQARVQLLGGGRRSQHGL